MHLAPFQNALLDAVAGDIARGPSVTWRLQFWLIPIFCKTSVVEFEKDHRTTNASFWLWNETMAREVTHKMFRPDFDELHFKSDDFEKQEILELNVSQARNIEEAWQRLDWMNIPDSFNHETRDGLWIFFRAFDGTRVHFENIINPERNTQPFGYAAEKWLLPFLNEVFDWTNQSKIARDRRAR